MANTLTQLLFLRHLYSSGMWFGVVQEGHQKDTCLKEIEELA